MLSFELNELQETIRDTARSFANDVVAPGASDRDKNAEFPTDIIQQVGELGFLGMNVPEEWDGSGLDNVSQCIVIEEFAKVDASVSVIVSVQKLVNSVLVRSASDSIKERYLKPMARGEMLGAYCLSEPEVGSDARGIKTMAIDQGDHYLINGSKNWITTGSKAGVFLVFAQTNPELKHKGITAFVMDAKSEGVSIGLKEDKMGLRSSDTVSLAFNNVKVPKENVVGKVGEGFYLAMQGLAGGRIGIASQALGLAKAAFDLSVKYSSERHTMGVPINQHQAIQIKLAQMSMKISAAELLVQKAAWLDDSGQDVSRQSSEAKLFASTIANDIAREAVQIHGGYGYVREYLVERIMRDAKITEIYEGTSEIQHIVIARDVIKNAQ
ncbi:MAG: acyl-CoA dehydrogenase [Ignavibacteriae bacterium HGW-Ignavibacteriae-4]|jgi:alkylation response protein AidB-like acyl-CoA dehydrogenase|nr:MAG: acyl-CoA dehydrogenase [Ignavibacteriae bacterium HGW-Ignavibacteriae-4]